MKVFRIPYHADFKKMIISGILGVWLHVLIDALQHRDMRPFWPSRIRPLYGLVGREKLETACIVFFVAAVIVYVVIAALYLKKDSTPKAK